MTCCERPERARLQQGHRRSSSSKTFSRRSKPAARWARDKEEYLFAVFGSPSTKDAWGWRVEGHHISLRFTVADGAARGNLSTSPMFLGANPAEVRDGDKKACACWARRKTPPARWCWRCHLEQQKAAIVNVVAPTDILTMNKNDITPLPDQGVTYAALRPEQQQALMRLIGVYANNMEADLAAERMAKIKAAGFDKIRFAGGRNGEGQEALLHDSGTCSSWSSTTRRTTAITSTRCGVTSMATSAGIYCAST